MFFHLSSCTNPFINCDSRFARSCANTHYLLRFPSHRLFPFFIVAIWKKADDEEEEEEEKGEHEEWKGEIENEGKE